MLASEGYIAKKRAVSTVDHSYSALCRPLRGPPRWALSEADNVCEVANFVIPPLDACIRGYIAKKRAREIREIKEVKELP